MSVLLKRMAVLVEDFVRREGQCKGVVGILVFGSFVKGKIHATSDLDFLVVREDMREDSITRASEEGIFLEVYRWPLHLFCRTLLGEEGSLFSIAFLFEVMRSGRILYDPKGILEKLKMYARTHKLSASHIKALVESVRKSLLLAKSLLEDRELEGAEIELRKSAEDLARAILLEGDVLEINPPKIYLPHLREKAPEFYSTFCEVHDLKKLDKNDLEAATQVMSEWCERAVKEVRQTGERHPLKGIVDSARAELSNAKDCLERGDIEAAALQVRYSALFLMSFMLGSHQDTASNPPSRRLKELLQSGHPYGATMKLVMNFRGDKSRLEVSIRILENIARIHA